MFIFLVFKGVLSREHLYPVKMDDTLSHPAEERQNVPNLLLRLLDYSQRFSIDLMLPTFVVIGLQSAGKTTFIQSFVRRAIGLSRGDIATYCPVVYTFEYHASSKDRYFFQDTEILPEQPTKPAAEILFHKVASHMETLKSRNSQQVCSEFYHEANTFLKDEKKFINPIDPFLTARSPRMPFL